MASKRVTFVSNFIKIRLAVLELKHADVQTVEWTNISPSFANFTHTVRRAHVTERKAECRGRVYMFLACDCVWLRFHSGRLNRVNGRMRRHTWLSQHPASLISGVTLDRGRCASTHPPRSHTRTPYNYEC